MNARFKFTLHAASVECEGSEQFVRENLREVIGFAAEAFRAISGIKPQESSSPGGVDSPMAISTSTVAARLSCDSGPSLILAAAGKLLLNDGVAICSRR